MLLRGVKMKRAKVAEVNVASSTNRAGRIPAYNLARITSVSGEVPDLVRRLLQSMPSDQPKIRMILLARKLDVSSWTVYRWLRGQNRPMTALLRTMQALDIVGADTGPPPPASETGTTETDLNAL